MSRFGSNFFCQYICVFSHVWLSFSFVSSKIGLIFVTSFFFLLSTTRIPTKLLKFCLLFLAIRLSYCEWWCYVIMNSTVNIVVYNNTYWIQLLSWGHLWSGKWCKLVRDGALMELVQTPLSTCIKRIQVSCMHGETIDCLKWNFWRMIIVGF